MRHFGPLSLQPITPPTPTLSFGLCRMLEKASPGSECDPRLCAGSSPRQAWARQSCSPERKASEIASSIQKFWARSGGCSSGTGPQGEEGMGAGPSHIPFSHLEKQPEAKQKAHLEEPVSTGMCQAHLDK
ncbi:hypothetical protein HJG60_010807 [Phyllostomus discolor]|uniref:Uncharacterized protein n=1 Tax=Phyllostomus discolor TaxID=89673 RepID=A0A834EA76_9CHIR|nr:hypothetical protein HJG60_010807 [Phyllostomus discolor]